MSNLKTASKTIDRILAASVPLDLSYASPANTKNITTELTTVLATAGEKGAAMPVVSATGAETVGLLENSVFGLKIPVTDGNGNVVDEAGGNNIYARLTEVGGVFTLKTYYNDAGTETIVSLPVGEYIAYIPYNFDLHRLPHDAFVRDINRGINDGGTSNTTPPTVYRFAVEAQTISTLNTLADLVNTPTDGSKVVINMRGWSGVASEGSITVAGKTVTWNSGAAGFDLAVGDVIWFTYEYEVV